MSTIGRPATGLTGPARALSPLGGLIRQTCDAAGGGNVTSREAMQCDWIKESSRVYEAMARKVFLPGYVGLHRRRARHLI